MGTPFLRWDYARAEREICVQITRGESIKSTLPSRLREAQEEERRWQNYNRTMLLVMFSDDTLASEYVAAARIWKISYSLERTDWENLRTVRERSSDDPVAELQRSIEKQTTCLASIVERLPLFPSSDDMTIVASAEHYCAPERVDQLRALRSERFDFAKLTRLCSELDVAWSTNSFFTVAALTRAVLDHVPPLFGLASFEEIANNYKGSKSFKDSMKQLTQARPIADGFLHGQIRRNEKLPTAPQVDFRSSIDVLLSEIVRVMSAE